jgi:hypothetical protein
MSFFSSGQPIVIPEPIVSGVQTVTAGSNVVITGTATNPIINATVPPQGVVTLNGTLTASGANEAEVANGLAGDCFGINTNAFNITGDAYLMTVTAQITSATFAPNTPNPTPNGYVWLAISVGSVVGSYPFIYCPFPKITTDITGANAGDYFITASGVFVSDPVEGVSVGIDNRSGCGLGTGQLTLNLTNISFVGLGNNVNVQTNWK